MAVNWVWRRLQSVPLVCSLQTKVCATLPVPRLPLSLAFVPRLRSENASNVGQNKLLGVFLRN
jgi:hypothetical protein